MPRDHPFEPHVGNLLERLDSPVVDGDFPVHVLFLKLSTKLFPDNFGVAHKTDVLHDSVLSVKVQRVVFVLAVERGNFVPTPFDSKVFPEAHQIYTV